jgi:hypothetical protein
LFGPVPNLHIAYDLASKVTMTFRKVSRDVKLAAIQLHQRDILPLCDILECCGFSE